ncbi:iodotyrosine deiodinase 1 isoform X2 [Vanessa atalanta]|uniref:iodotyrosine deiodinase 1 isoform X2 n=1 Tax=Vanessa atalanta TaxID=42275 RepID=UPI001FCDC17E|nr:iodotyrosine deiodinase 1 isoform X2 [Vanessa atalanta]
MNVISLVVWTLESNCFIVYTVMIVLFVAFTMFHKNRLEENQNRIGLKKKFANNNGGREREHPDDDDDPDFLVPAFPEDTPHIPYKPPKRPMEDVLRRSLDYYELMAKRRTVRKFSTEPIPQEVLDNIVKTAVVQDPSTKEAIRGIVEEEEEQNYARRMSRQWVTDLKPFATNHIKPYLSDAPALILVFRQSYSWRADGKKKMHYYNEISVAIAAGFLLAAIQYCGLVALTSTPLNCNARLRDLLSRPANERLELLLPVGRPHEEATVPDLTRKDLHEIMINV